MSNQLQKVVCVILATFAAVCLNATATSATWSGANDSAWSNTSNWSANPVPGTGDTATIDNAGSSHVTIDLAGGVTVSNLLFDTVNAAAYTIGSGGAGNQTLTLNNGGMVIRSSTVTNSQLINANLTLGTASGGTYTVTNGAATGTLTLAGAIAGGVGGAKTLKVTGSNTTIIISGSITNASASSLAIDINGSSQVTLSGKISGNTKVTQSVATFGAPTGKPLTITNDANDFTGQFSALGAYGAKVYFTSLANYGIACALGKGTAGTTISLSNGWLVYTGAVDSISDRTWSGVNSNQIQNDGTGVLTLSGSMEQATANGTFTLSGSNTGLNKFGGNISRNAVNLGFTKSGAGRWVLSGSNSYNGVTSVSSGTLVVDGLNTNGGAWTVSSGATLAGSGTIGTTNVNVTISGTLSNGAPSGTLTMDLGTGMLNVTNAQALVFGLGSARTKVNLASGTLKIGSVGFSRFTLFDAGGMQGGDYTLFHSGSAIDGSLTGNLSGVIGGHKNCTLSFANGNKDLILTVPRKGTLIRVF